MAGVNKYSVEEDEIEFDVDGFALSSGYALVYLADRTSREFKKATREWVSVGTTVAAHSYTDAPDITSVGSDEAIVRSTDGKSWTVEPDYRGTIVYLKEDGSSYSITTIGAIPDTYTTVVPPIDSVVKWDDATNEWVPDSVRIEAINVENARVQLDYGLEAADANITHIEEAISRNSATTAESESLDGWRDYRIGLNRIDYNLGSGIVWPALSVTYSLPKYPITTLPRS